MGDAKAKEEGDLVRVQDALEAADEARVVMEEAKHKAKAEVARLKVPRLKVTRLKVERTSLLLEIGATKDKISSLHSQASKDKEAIEEDYQKALEVIFAYAFGCCAFKHNICGDQPKVPDGMPVSFDQLLLSSL